MFRVNYVVYDCAQAHYGNYTKQLHAAGAEAEVVLIELYNYHKLSSISFESPSTSEDFTKVVNGLLTSVF